MLFQTVFPPTNFTSVPQDPIYQKFFYDKLVGILKDFVENCIVLVDDAGTINKNWHEVIKSLPDPWRTEVMELHEELDKKNRFVKVQVSGNHCNPLKCKVLCQNCFNLAMQFTPAYIFATEECLRCLSASNNSNIVDISEYELSRSWKKERKNHYFLVDSQWTKKDFEEKILIPIFKYATKVDLYDPIIGNKLVNDDGSIKPFLKNYYRTLKWILETFQRESCVKSKEREISIHTRLDPLKGQALGEVEKVLKGFKKEMEKEIEGLNLGEIKVNGRMPHDRFIKTDQIALQIGRGFDLIKENNVDRIRDVTVTCCSDFENFFKPVKRVR